MSDGTLEWFDGIVQSCSSDGFEAVIVYDDGDSFLLDIADGTEWRPVLPKVLELPVAASTAQSTSTDASSISSDRKSNDPRSREQTNDVQKSHFVNPQKSDLSLYSLLRKLTGVPSIDFPSENKNPTTVDTKTNKQAKFHLEPSFSDGHNKKESSNTTPNLSDEEEIIVYTKDSLSSKKRTLQNDRSSLDDVDASRPTKKQKQDLPQSNHNLSQVRQKPQKEVRFSAIPQTIAPPNVLQEKQNNKRCTTSTTMQKKVPPTYPPIVENGGGQRNEQLNASSPTEMSTNDLTTPNQAEYPSFIHPPIHDSDIENKKPVAIGTLQRKHTSTQSGDIGDPFQSLLSDEAKEYLASVQITTIEQLLLTTKSVVAKNMPEWRKEKGLYRISKTNCRNIVGDWKQKVILATYNNRPFDGLLPSVIAECLQSIGTTTCAQLLAAPTHHFVVNIQKWAKENGKRFISNKRCAALLKTWKRKIIQGPNYTESMKKLAHDFETLYGAMPPPLLPRPSRNAGVETNQPMVTGTPPPTKPFNTSDPFQNLLPDEAKEYLASIQITTCKELLELSVPIIASSMKEWRKQKGMHEISKNDSKALVYSWKEKIAKASFSDPLPDRVSSPAKEYLQSIGITTGTELLKLPTSFIAKDMNKWRMEKGLHEIDEDNCADLVNTWKRDAIPPNCSDPIQYLLSKAANDYLKFMKITTGAQLLQSPSSFVARSLPLWRMKHGLQQIDYRNAEMVVDSWKRDIACAIPMDEPSGVDQGATAIVPTMDKGDDLLNHLGSKMAKAYLASIYITTSAQLINTPTSHVAYLMNEWRIRNGMLPLSEGSCEILVNNWKNQIMEKFG